MHHQKGSDGEHALQAKYGSQNRAQNFYDNQMIDYLNEHMQAFIANQELLFISTADRKGNCDTSLRAGLPGFVRCIDKKTLIYPEYRGNGVYASLGNISENPHIGLLFIDFIVHRIGLHVNGRAEIVELDMMHEKLAVPKEDIMRLQQSEPNAERWIAVYVEEAYIHCSKHIPHYQKINKPIYWGSDDINTKGSNSFHIKSKKETSLKK